ncbi:MAG: sugar phosphate isomerase/epimerase [Actinomycetota bacterium]|nr:sugar phosphate isomerase/epimerase [Actinomycetota bacterium]
MSAGADQPTTVSVPRSRVALSTASVFPEPAEVAFELAGSLGFDAVELMVGLDETSQDVAAVRRLRERHQLPIVAVHAPCLLITQRVWGSDPWEKLERSARAARVLGADTVVVHPPFRWQRDYARGFRAGITGLETRTGLAFAVENMYPWRARGRRVQAYAPGWDPVDHGYAHVTLDLSHSATAGGDPLATAAALGERLSHVHMTDGSGSSRDEHLVPGRGGQPCAAFCELLAARDFDGHVVVEVNTRRADSRAEREADLAEALAFTRLHLAARGGASSRTVEPSGNRAGAGAEEDAGC